MSNNLQHQCTLYATYAAREIAKSPVLSSLTPKHDSKWGGKTKGETIYFKVPPKYAVNTTMDITSAIQDVQYTEKSLTLDTLANVPIMLTAKELVLDFDKSKEMREAVIKPATNSIVEYLETTLQAKMYKKVKHNFNTSTPSTSPTALSNYTNAGALLTEYGASKQNRKLSISPTSMGLFVNANSGLFNPQPAIGKQYESGEVRRAIGFDWMENACNPMHTCGQFGGTPLVNGASQSGASLITDGWPASTAILKAGDVFSISGVYQVATKAGSTNINLGSSYFYTAASDVTSDGSGNATIPLIESVSATAGKGQNVDSLPSDNAAITVVGTTGIQYRQNLVYIPKAVAFATVKMETPKNAEFSGSGTYGGITVTIVRDFDILKHRFITRMDVLCGLDVIYPEFAGRIWSPV